MHIVTLLNYKCKYQSKAEIANLTFDFMSPVFTDSCNILNNPVGGSYTLSSNGTTTFSNYSCIAGYSMVGEPDRTCQPDQTWSPPAPYCGNIQLMKFTALFLSTLELLSDIVYVFYIFENYIVI